jgi:hypothetical protein
MLDLVVDGAVVLSVVEPSIAAVGLSLAALAGLSQLYSP